MAGLLRVTGGRLVRRRFKVPDRGVRPTSDKAREALFSVLGPSVLGARVADLYAGSGALGIEALSRGAARCVFVERDKGAARVLAENLESLELGGTAEVQIGEAGRRAAELPAGGFDLVFCDPPYDDALPPTTWAAMVRALAEGGQIVLERRARSEDVLPDELACTFDRTWGEARVRILAHPSHGKG